MLVHVQFNQSVHQNRPLRLQMMSSETSWLQSVEFGDVNYRQPQFLLAARGDAEDRRERRNHPSHA